MGTSHNKEKRGQGYSPGNVTDRIKHSNLEKLAVLACPQTYVEFHSGCGIYDTYKGSSLRVIEKMEESYEDDYSAFLHEVDPERNSTLCKNTSEFNGLVCVRKDWKDHVEEYLCIADAYSLFLIDPTYVSEYYEQGGLMDYLPDLIDKGATLFLYVPEKFNDPLAKRTIGCIRSAAEGKGIDLMHPSVKGGRHARTDHNIIISGRGLESEIPMNHLNSIKKYDRYKRFSGFNTPFKIL